MSDRQPLLDISRKRYRNSGDAEQNQLQEISRGFDWREWLSFTKNMEKYVKLPDNEETQSLHDLASFFRLFHFDSGVDVLLAFITVLTILVTTITFLLETIFIAQITALFAAKSCNVTCDNQVANSSVLYTNSTTYNDSFGSNTLKSASLSSWNHRNNIVVNSTLNPSTASFHTIVMQIVYGLFGLGCIEATAFILQYACWEVCVKRRIMKIRVSLFRSLLQRNISYFDARSAAKYHSYLFENTSKIENALGLEFTFLGNVVLSIFGCAIASFVLHWKLTLAMLFLVPVAISSLVLFSKVTARMTTKQISAYSGAAEITQEVFSSIRTVHSLNGSDFEKERFEKQLMSSRLHSIKMGVSCGAFTGWFSFVHYSTYAIGFIFGSMIQYNNSNHYSSIATILLVTLLFAQNLHYCSFVGVHFQALAEAHSVGFLVFRLIDEGNDASINEPDIYGSKIDRNGDLNGDIKFENVSFIYPSREERPVLRDLSLIAPVGQTTAIVGSSGSGKSTCLSLLLRFYKPSSGRITIAGKSIVEYNLKQLRQGLAFVGQEPALFATSVYENIRYGKLDATRSEVERAAREANAHDFIMKLPEKYETLVGERGIKLSGGEKQRIALARALVRQPRILLLDEATSALDNVSEKLVQDALDRACKDRTTIVIAHRLSTIQNADKIYVLENGSVVEEGTHETLMTREGSAYQRMVKLQQMENNATQTATIEIENEPDEFTVHRSRSLSDSHETDQREQEQTKTRTQRFAFLRLLLTNKGASPALAIALLMCILCGCSELIFSVVLAKIIEAFKYCSIAERRQHVVATSSILLGVGIVVWVARCIQHTAFATSGSRIIQRVRARAFACLLRQEIAYFDRPENNSGSICTRLSTDASSIQAMIESRIGIVFEAIAMALAGVIYGFIVSWKITFVLVGFIIAACLILVGDVMLRAWMNHKLDEIMSRASQLTADALQNLRTVKQLSTENELVEQYSNLLGEKFRSYTKLLLPYSIAFALTWSINVPAIAAVYWCALALFERNELNPKNIIMMIGLILFALQAIKFILTISGRVGASVSAAETFLDLFDRQPLIDNTSTEGDILDDFKGSIAFDKVQFVYPTRPTARVLKKVQLNIQSGQQIALVGPSGCGKSTVMQLLERFYDVTNGQLLFDGVDIRKLNLQWVRSQIGLVSQEPILFDLTVAENISYGLKNASMEDIIDAAKRANIHQFIEQLPQGYDTRVGAGGSFLSGGEKQRVAIARMLIRRPKILLLDEATSAMDSQNEQIVQETLEHVQQEGANRTSLTIAHRLSTVRSCDSVYVLDQGRVIERGTHDELMQKQGAYYRMVIRNSSL